MAKSSRYCKAYVAREFRRFTDWKENTTNLRTGLKEVDGREVEFERTAIDEEDPLYLHDNYIVTDGIFNDENVVFQDVTDEWKKFCDTELRFQIPEELK